MLLIYYCCTLLYYSYIYIYLKLSLYYCCTLLQYSYILRIHICIYFKLKVYYWYAEYNIALSPIPYHLSPIPSPHPPPPPATSRPILAETRRQQSSHYRSTACLSRQNMRWCGERVLIPAEVVIRLLT